MIPIKIRKQSKTIWGKVREHLADNWPFYVILAVSFSIMVVVYNILPDDMINDPAQENSTTTTDYRSAQPDPDEWYEIIDTEKGVTLRCWERWEDSQTTVCYVSP